MKTTLTTYTTSYSLAIKTALAILDAVPPNGAMLPTFARFLALGEGLTIALDGISTFRGVAFYVDHSVIKVPDRQKFDIMVWVQPQFRRQGIGRDLVHALREIMGASFEPELLYQSDEAQSFFRNVLAR